MTVNIYARTYHDTLTLAELRLYHDITAYRASLGLAAVPLSAALTATAGRHVLDMRENIWAENLTLPAGANLHSWSDAPYYSDHRHPEAMWEAPARLGTGYRSSGYEIAAAGVDGAGALAGWKASPGHNAVLTQTGIWANTTFLAMGIGLETSAGAGPYGGKAVTVWFGAAADTGIPAIVGTNATETIRGTAFRDALYAYGGNDVIDGGGGSDFIRAGYGDDSVTGGAGNDTIYGDAGNDRIAGGISNDKLFGGDGNDTLSGDGGDDQIWGDAGDDWISGGIGHDVLYGGAGRDRLHAVSGGDWMNGGPGADWLHAGVGPDTMFGGTGADGFIFTSAAAAGLGRVRDSIRDFTSGEDYVNLASIDANTRFAGDQAFDFIGARAFTGAGQLRHAGGILEGDVDGDGVADFQISLTGRLLETDILL